MGFSHFRPVARRRKLERISDLSVQPQDGLEENKKLQMKAESTALQLKNRIVQRDNGDSEEEEEQDLAGAVGDVATAVAATAGDTDLGAAMEAIAELAEGAGGAQEALGSSEVVPRLAGAARALNTVAGMVGQGVPIVGQAASAVELAQSVIEKIPAAQNGSRLAYNSVAQWLERRERNRADREHADLLDRMERGEL